MGVEESQSEPPEHVSHSDKGSLERGQARPANEGTSMRAPRGETTGDASDKQCTRWAGLETEATNARNTRRKRKRRRKANRVSQQEKVKKNKEQKLKSKAA
ncbi:hypothetical protein R1flu_017795 [Riccia fluitans]|uniref:BZIP domain-containing protein n=1 Tax=Riccia fluitans TaxID=41844 RepID=A0ABD1ZDZ0_9MARC